MLKKFCKIGQKHFQNSQDKYFKTPGNELSSQVY